MRVSPTPLLELDARERRAAAATLAAAFHHDPLFAWFVPGDARRRRWLEAFMRASLAMGSTAGQSWRVPGDGEVPAVVTLFGPGRYPSRWREVAFAARLLPRLAIGQPSPRRAVVGARALARLEAVHPSEPHWYLFQLGVHPGHQGRGLGRAIVEQGTDRADADGLPAYLETSNPLNLDFYARFGFEVRDALELGETPPIWTMWRPAR